MNDCAGVTDVLFWAALGWGIGLGAMFVVVLAVLVHDWRKWGDPLYWLRGPRSFP